MDRGPSLAEGQDKGDGQGVAGGSLPSPLGCNGLLWGRQWQWGRVELLGRDGGHRDRT